MSPSILVAVCTFKRPDDIVQLLDSMIVALEGNDADLLVVDNDPAGSAGAAVSAHPLDAKYVICDQPGIAQARNAALAHRQGYESIVFVDDDETVEPNWLTELVRGAVDFDADVATGPVISTFPPGTPRWIIDGGFVQRARHPSGTAVEFAATNNVLIRNRVLDRLSRPEFDVEFSRTGGSDAELTWRLTRAGAKVVWIDSAVVNEVMPLDRLTLRWIVKRLVRGGNGRARMLRREKSKAAVVWIGSKLMARGALATIRSLVLGRGLQSRDVTMLAHGFGVAQTALGSMVYEYSRG